jgi:hypothetical protein
VKAVPAPGSVLVEWEVVKGAAVTNRCEATNPANQEDLCSVYSFGTELKVKAVFEATGPPPIPLAINAEAGTGSGQIACIVNGGALEDKPCEESYEEGTELELIAEADEGSSFVAFENGTGDASSCSTSPCTPFELNNASELDANFELETRQLEVEEPGSGSGATTVECDGGSCPALTEIPYGTMVKVTASADTGSELTLSGDHSAASCSGSPCEFELKEDSKVVVSYDLELRELEIEEPGSGSGTTTVECDGGSCPALTEIPYGTMVKVTAGADTGSEVALSGTGSAEGECSGSTCEFELTEDSKVVVSYDLEEFSLTIHEPGSGSGTVSCKDEGSPVSCAGPFLYGHAIEVDALAGSHNELTALTGAGSAAGKCTLENTTEGSCSFTIDEDSEVSVTFEVEPGLVTFQQHVTGSGSGEITCDGGPCETSYTEGTVVELEAVPSGGHSLFKGWTVSGSGSVGTPCTGTTNPCEVGMQAPGPLSASAEFGAIKIAGVSPDEGPTAGSQLVTITGENFGGATEVKFGASGVSCPSAECTIESGAEIKVEAPAHAAGTVDVELTTPGGSATATAAYTYVAAPTIGSVSPDEGPAAGGQTVTIEGTNLANVSAVKFGGSAATIEPGGSATDVEVKTPSHAAGTVDVELTTPGGSATATAAYTYVAAPAVTGVVPGEGPIAGGNTVAINGTDLGGATKVEFGAAAVSAGEFLSNTATKIEVEAPAHAEGTVDVTVTTVGGASATGVADRYTYLTPAKSLTIEEGGSGSGSVKCDSGSGPEPCEATYPTGTTVTVVAMPAAGSEFTAWSGECDAVAGNRCEVTLDADKAVEATFTLQDHILTVSKGGTGTGTVTSSPAGIDCGASCSHAYDHGASVTLSASPGAISDFAGWSGCDQVIGGQCKVAMTAARAVTATFSVRTHTLTIEELGPGSGSVSCDGGPCASSYPEGATVTLHANPDSGSSFFGWAGAGCTSGGDCVVTLDRDATVAAAFEANPPAPPPSSAPAPGAAIANPAAWVKGNKALLKLRCRGEQGARCRGQLKLIARVRIHGKKRNVVVGRSKYNLPTNSAVRVLRAKLTRGGFKLVRRAGSRGLRVKLVGKGASNRVVKLKQWRGANKRRRHGKRGGRR